MSKETKAWFTVDELNAWAEKKLKENPQWADQPAQQEPVATVMSETGADISMSWWHEPALPVGTPLYTTPHPAQRTWVGLTDEEIESINCVYLDWMDYEQVEIKGDKEFARAIEAKLKEKNT